MHAPPARPFVAIEQPLASFEQLAAMFMGWNGRFEQLTAGRFQGHLRVVQGRMLRIVSVEANQTVLLRGQAAKGLLSLYPVAPSNADGVWHGRRLDPGNLVVHGRDADTNHRSARNCRMLGLTVPFEQVERAAQLIRSDRDRELADWSARCVPPERLAALERSIRRLLSIDTDDAAESGHCLEQLCLLSVLDALLPDGDGRERSDLPLPARTLLTKRADELMRHHLAKPLGEIDLCGALGVSDRTLRLAFRERFSMGPMVYYRALRLNAVRVMLRSFPMSPVAALAKQLGFHHLGNFAADYRRLFGELPSRTRKENRGVRRVDSSVRP